MKLYEIAADYRELLEAIEAGEIPEEAIADTLESITSVLEDKVDNIACFIKNLTAEVDAIKAEEQKLAKRRKTKERQIARVTDYLANTLLASGYTKVETKSRSERVKRSPFPTRPPLLNGPRDITTNC